MELSTFRKNMNVAVVGASGGIGPALIVKLTQKESINLVFSISRQKVQSHNQKNISFQMNIEDENSFLQTSSQIKRIVETLDLIIVATGRLSTEDKRAPEKTCKLST